MKTVKKNKKKLFEAVKESETYTKFPHYWICSACATERGGKWPKDHVATAIKESCKYCNGPEEIIYPWIDFNWPKDKDRDKAAKFVRD